MAPTPRTILVVDDEEPLLDVMSRLLGSRGHRLTLCRSVEEAIQAIASVEHDVVFTDWRLPDGPAGRLIRAVRAARPEIPIYVVTATPEDPGVLDADADLVIAKPFSLETIISLAEV